jgi:Na+/H+ antiporter NhaC
METGLILAFAMGFIVCKIFTILFLTKRLEAFILEIHLQALFFLGMIAEDFAYSRANKYLSMLESGKSTKEIDNLKEYDLKKEREAKESIIRVYKAAFPRDFKFMVEGMTWDTALEELTKQIKNQRK